LFFRLIIHALLVIHLFYVHVVQKTALARTDLNLPWNATAYCERRLLERSNKPGNALLRVSNYQCAVEGRNEVLLQQQFRICNC